MRTTIRRDPIYLSTEVYRALWLIAKTCTSDDGQRIMTADEVADTMLHDAILEKYPQLFAHQQKVDKMEQELLETLTGAKK